MSRWLRYMVVATQAMYFFGKCAAAKKVVDQARADAQADGNVTAEETAAIEALAGQLGLELLDEGAALWAKTGGK